MTWMALLCYTLKFNFILRFHISKKVKRASGITPSNLKLQTIFAKDLNRFSKKKKKKNFQIDKTMKIYRCQHVILNKWRSLDCALFCCEARRKRLENERSVGRNTSWVLYPLPKCFTTEQSTVKASLFVL